jgi:ABC-type branched-subunit amino acid transport system ATPase component
MIRKVVLKNFKRFEDVTFEVPGHLVLAGPNNTGKTTLLQAIAAWSFGYAKWAELGDTNPRANGYTWQDLERGQFSAVALRSFDLLWNNRLRDRPLEVGIQFDGHAGLMTMEFRFRAPGLAQVRPKRDTDAMLLGLSLAFSTTFIPAIAGLAREERRLADQESLFDLLAQARAGEVLRNLLVLAHQKNDAWIALNEALSRMFGIVMLPPIRGAELICEYKSADQIDNANATKFDVASAGSGVLQVLLVLSLMLTQTGRVLLIDEPDAHLHLILQRTIYNELRAIAVRNGCQLFIATHSEELINSVDPRELCLMYGTPRLVASDEEKANLVRSLGSFTHGDLLHANGARGVLYAEDYTDFDLLANFARALGDEAALKLLTVQIVRKRAKAEQPEGLGKLSPAEHWKMLKLVNAELPAAELIDGDSKNAGDELITGNATRMQRLRWRYYEIESYLLIPRTWERFLDAQLGATLDSEIAYGAAMQELEKKLEKSYHDAPLQPSDLQARYLQTEPVSKTLIPAMLQAAGLNNFPKNRYSEIAALMQPEDVHPEIKGKLLKLKQAFGIEPLPAAPANPV